MVRVDEGGAVVSTASPATDVREVIGTPGLPTLVGRTETGFVLMDTAGAVIREWSLEPVGRSMQVAVANFGVPIDDPHLAVLTTSSPGIGRASLVIFTAAGDVAYRRILETSTGLLAVPRPSGDLLLVGDGASRVWMLQRPLEPQPLR